MKRMRMKREIRVDAGSYCLCFVWFPHSLWKTPELQNRRVGRRASRHMGIKLVKIIKTILLYGMETNQFWRSERVECVEDILTRGFR